MSEDLEDIQWYIARDGQQHGPLSETEMRLFVDGGHLLAADLLWRPGFDEWRAASLIFPTSELSPASATPEAPSVTASAPSSGEAASEKTQSETASEHAAANSATDAETSAKTEQSSDRGVSRSSDQAADEAATTNTTTGTTANG